LQALQLEPLVAPTDAPPPPEFDDFSGLDNAEQRLFAEGLSGVLEGYGEVLTETNEQKNKLADLWKQADTLLKIKNDKAWADLDLPQATKRLDEHQQTTQAAYQQAVYWYESMAWLHERFPEGTYQNVTGLCKAAPREEYADEQDYSLNAGRYVGVEIETENMSVNEFTELIKLKAGEFTSLSKDAIFLEKSITETLESLVI
jgi:type I restriction enzyme M protein